jgi:hypothetical protein
MKKGNPVTTHRTIRPSSIGAESKLAFAASQAASGPGEKDPRAARGAERVLHSERSTAGDTRFEQKQETSSPPFAARRVREVLSECTREIATPLAGRVRKMGIVELLGTIAYVLLGIYARPPGLPMPFWAFGIFLILASPLRTLLGRLIDRVMPNTRHDSLCSRCGPLS